MELLLLLFYFSVLFFAPCLIFAIGLVVRTNSEWMAMSKNLNPPALNILLLLYCYFLVLIENNWNSKKIAGYEVPANHFSTLVVAKVGNAKLYCLILFFNHANTCLHLLH